MVAFNVEGAQNVEVSKKIPCEKSLMEQLEIMERYTAVHEKNQNESKARREVECLKVLYPTMFRSVERQDLITGRLDFLPIGFGCVTSVGGVGHYCVFNKLRSFQNEISSLGEEFHERVERLYDYWLKHDLKTKYCREVLTETTIGRFIDVEYPMIATARLSGMMLDYPKLLENGVGGLKDLIRTKSEGASAEQRDLYACMLESLDLVTASADALREKVEAEIDNLSSGEGFEIERHKLSAWDENRRRQLRRMADALGKVRTEKPETFPEALQLLWLYALLAGVINYGRLDDFLGPYLCRDLETGRLTREEAKQYLKSLWTMIENRRTTVNGRIIVGGRGRKHPKEADVFMHLALEVCRECKYVEPQFTLRIDRDTDGKTWQEALDALGDGCTYPTLYNDAVNVPAVAYGMRVDEETAARYVPFGCTEFVLWGQSTGTPNVCINLLKLLTIYMNHGIDPMDGKNKLGGLPVRRMEEIRDFEDFWQGYRELLDHYMDLCIQAQVRSYEVMNEEVSFLFNSILMDDCIARGKALLDGGVRYLGGTCETYGNINVSDSLVAVKRLVFEEKKYTLTELEDAMLHNFKGHEKLRKDCLACEKYGNDLEAADGMANLVYEYVAKGIRDRGTRYGMQYYLIVISNNSLNTEWGIRTGASPDGRLSGTFMNPANNPQGGAHKIGPTALLNSLTTFDAKYHAGSVQNIRFEKSMFQRNKSLMKSMFETYFGKGGCHLMVTVVDRGALEDAMEHPEKFPDLIVRVAGYSAVFVNLDRTVQEEIISRTTYE